MGIKNLNTLLKNKTKALEVQPLSNWNSRRIAIDAINLGYILWSTAYKNVVNGMKNINNKPDREKARKIWLKNIWSFIRRLLLCGITPVIVFDGKAPKEKKKTQQDRRKKTSDTLDKINVILGQHKEKEISQERIEELKKLYRRSTRLETKEIQMLRDVFKAIGLPVLQAKGEAEELCSTLCREGRVAAVYSRDTDNLVYRCPVLITNISGQIYNQKSQIYEDQVNLINFKFVLHGLKLNHQQFVDVCIMAKCDYNENIPRIGIMRSYNLIKEYSSIDNLPSQYNISCLTHIKCRELFSLKSYEDICSNVDYSLIIDYSCLTSYARETLEFYHISHWLNDLVKIYDKFPKPFEGRFILSEKIVTLNIIGKKKQIQRSMNDRLKKLVTLQLKRLNE